jgi:hypothetical protein
MGKIEEKKMGDCHKPIVPSRQDSSMQLYVNKFAKPQIVNVHVNELSSMETIVLISLPYICCMGVLALHMSLLLLYNSSNYEAAGAKALQI